jgi:hypothetical protein
MDFCFPEKTPLKPLSTTFSKISVFALSQGLCIFLKLINKFQLNSVSSLDMSVPVPIKNSSSSLGLDVLKTYLTTRPSSF